MVGCIKASVPVFCLKRWGWGGYRGWVMSLVPVRANCCVSRCGSYSWCCWGESLQIVSPSSGGEWQRKARLSVVFPLFRTPNKPHATCFSGMRILYVLLGRCSTSEWEDLNVSCQWLVFWSQAPLLSVPPVCIFLRGMKTKEGLPCVAVDALESQDAAGYVMCFGWLNTCNLCALFVFQ